MSVTNFPNGVAIGDVLLESTGITLGGLVLESTGLKLPSEELTASAAISLSGGLVLLNHATVVIAATLAAPEAGDLIAIVNNSASGTAAHTVTLAAGVTWDGTNDVATLDAPGEALLAVAISATRFFVLANIGTVAFS